MDDTEGQRRVPGGGAIPDEDDTEGQRKDPGRRRSPRRR